MNCVHHFIGGAVAEISRKLPRKTCFLLSDKYRAGVDGIIGTYRGMFNYHMVKFLPARKYKSDRYSNDAACSHRVRCIVDCPQKTTHTSVARLRTNLLTFYCPFRAESS